MSGRAKSWDPKHILPDISHNMIIIIVIEFKIREYGLKKVFEIFVLSLKEVQYTQKISLVFIFIAGCVDILLPT